MRERGGSTKTALAATEANAVNRISQNVAQGSTVHADEASHWDILEARYPIKRINHQEAYSKDGACTNQAESLFSRLRRSEIGIHHHIAGKYLQAYASEMAFREDARRESNGTQLLLLASASMAAPKSIIWCGYWQNVSAR